MIRKQAFIHFNEQPFKDLIDRIYEVAPEVDTATSSEKDPDNQRHSDVSWIDPKDEHKDIFEFINEAMNNANQQSEWHFDVPIIEPLQFTEYKVGQRYDWHVDQFMGYEDTIRKISFSILLNDDFEGGEFEIEAGSPAKSAEDRIHKINLKKGDGLFFPSYTWHRVRPVTKGTRHSLVGWCRGPQWR